LAKTKKCVRKLPKNLAVYIFGSNFSAKTIFLEFLKFFASLDADFSLGSEEFQKYVFSPQNVDFGRKREIFTAQLGYASKTAKKRSRLGFIRYIFSAKKNNF